MHADRDIVDCGQQASKVTSPAPAPLTAVSADARVPSDPTTPQNASSSAEAPVIAESTDSASTAERLPKLRGSRKWPVEYITSRMRKAMRLVAEGANRDRTCKSLNISIAYFTRVMRSPLGQAEWQRLLTKLDGGDSASDGAKPSKEANAVTDEIDASTLEAVKELRAILRSSTSAHARALAAKELLDLAQAKKRYIAATSGAVGDAVSLSPDDIQAFVAAINDLRTINALYKEDRSHAVPNPALNRTKAAPVDSVVDAPVDPILDTVDKVMDPATITAVESITGTTEAAPVDEPVESKE